MTWRRRTLRPGDTRCRVYKKCVRFFFSFHPLISPFLCLRTRGLWFAVLTLLIPFVSSFHLILGQRGLLATYLPSISHYGYTATLEYRKAILCCKHTTQVLTRSPGDPAAAEVQGMEQPLPGAGQGSGTCSGVWARQCWHSQGGTAPCRAVLCQAVLCHAARRCTGLGCAVPGCAKLSCAGQHHAMQHGDVPCQAVLSCAVPCIMEKCHARQCCARPCQAVLCRAAPCHASWGCAMPGCAKLCCARQCHAMHHRDVPCQAVPSCAVPCLMEICCARPC